MAMARTRRHTGKNLQPKTMSTKEGQRTSTAHSNSTENWYTTLYVQAVSEGTGCRLSKYGIRVAHKQTKTLRSQLMQSKNPLKVEEKSGVVLYLSSEIAAATTFAKHQNV